MKLNRLLLIILLLILYTCDRKKNPLYQYDENDFAFAIYFLQDENLKMKDVNSEDVNELKLSPKPWLCDKDIRFYDWSSHCIYLKKDKTHFFPNWENNKFNEFPPEWADKPFVVVANGKRCYLGHFEHSALSHLWLAPTITDGYNSGYPSDVLFVDWIWLYHDYPQNNPNVKSALMKAGLYHGGISVTFDTTDTNTLRMVENADTSTISYKFTITNNDENNLYVLDPDKTGSGLFHRFTNGPVFKNLESGKLYESRWKKTVKLPSLEYWSPDWFIKLESGHSIQRTVILRGYSYFPTGEYIFEFRYDGKIFGMEKEVRELADGRYWLGPTRSNILVWSFKAAEDPLNNTTSQQILGKHNQFLDEYLHFTPTAQDKKLLKMDDMGD